MSRARSTATSTNSVNHCSITDQALIFADDRASKPGRTGSLGGRREALHQPGESTRCDSGVEQNRSEVDQFMTRMGAMADRARAFRVEDCAAG